MMQGNIVEEGHRVSIVPNKREGKEEKRRGRLWRWRKSINMEKRREDSEVDGLHIPKQSCCLKTRKWTAFWHNSIHSTELLLRIGSERCILQYMICTPTKLLRLICVWVCVHTIVSAVRVEQRCAHSKAYVGVHAGRSSTDWSFILSFSSREPCFPLPIDCGVNSFSLPFSHWKR